MLWTAFSSDVYEAQRADCAVTAELGLGSHLRLRGLWMEIHDPAVRLAHADYTACYSRQGVLLFHSQMRRFLDVQASIEMI